MVWTLNAPLPKRVLFLDSDSGAAIFTICTGQDFLRFFEARMSGVIVAMRRTLKSCTSLTRNGLLGLAAALLPPVGVAWAAEARPVGAVSTLFDSTRQEIAVLAAAT